MTAQPLPTSTVKNNVSASTKSHLNDALKRSLADATTVLHEERASSVATSSSSLSSDELTNIAKRAMQAAHLKRTTRLKDDDDATIGSASTSRSSRFSAAKKRVQNRKRIEDDDAASVTSVVSNNSQQQVRNRAMMLAAQAQRRKKESDETASCSDEFSIKSSEKRLRLLPKNLPRQATPPRKGPIALPRQEPPALGIDDETRPQNETEAGSPRQTGTSLNPRNTRLSQDAIPQRGADTRNPPSTRDHSPLPNASKDVSTDIDTLDDVSVASQHSSKSLRSSRRRAYLAAAERARSTSPNVNCPSSVPRHPTSLNPVKPDSAPDKNREVDTTQATSTSSNTNSDKGSKAMMLENIPKVRSMLVEASASNASEDTPKVENRSVANTLKVSPSNSTSTSETRTRKFGTMAMSNSNVNMEKVSLTQSHGNVFKTGESLRSSHEVSRPIFQKTESKSQRSQANDVLSQLPTLIQQAKHGNSAQAKDESVLKFRNGDQSPAASTTSSKIQESSNAAALRSGNTSPSGSMRSGHAGHPGKSTPSPPRNTSTRSPKTNRSDDAIRYPATSPRDTCDYSGDSMSPRKARTRIEAFEKAHAKQRMHPVDMGPSRTHEYRKQAAMRTKNNSPQRGRVSTHRAMLAKSAATCLRSTPIDAVKEENVDRHNHVERIDENKFPQVNVEGPNDPTDATPEPVASVQCSDVSLTASVPTLSSPEKPLAAQNAYLKHLEQKRGAPVAALLSPKTTSHQVGAITPAQIQDSVDGFQPNLLEQSQVDKIAEDDRSHELRHSSDAKVENNDVQLSNKTNKELVSDHEADPLTKPSEDSLLDYSESEAGSNFSGIRNCTVRNDGGGRLRQKLPEERINSLKADTPERSNEDLSPATSRIDIDGPTLIGQCLVTSASSEEGTTKFEDKPPSPFNASVGPNCETGSQVSAALQWWQMNYAQNQDQRVNRLVEDALTRPSTLTSTGKTSTPNVGEPPEIDSNKDPGKRASQSKYHPSNPQKKVEGSFDEESLFSGLDEFARSDSLSISDDKQALDEPRHSSHVQASKLMTAALQTNSAPNKFQVPPPPPQKHVGEVLDESQLMDTVNSDITSSVVAGEGAKDPAKNTYSSLVIKEEKSEEVDEENDTDKSERGGQSKTSLKKTKSRASAKSAKSRDSLKKLPKKKLPEEDISEGESLFDQDEFEGTKFSFQNVFINLGHTILDQFEYICRAPGKRILGCVRYLSLIPNKSPISCFQICQLQPVKNYLALALLQTMFLKRIP